MEQPDDCPDALYALMRACWHEGAKKRPTFAGIVARLAGIIDTVSASASAPAARPSVPATGHEYVDLISGAAEVPEDAYMQIVDVADHRVPEKKAHALSKFEVPMEQLTEVAAVKKIDNPTSFVGVLAREGSKPAPVSIQLLESGGSLDAFGATSVAIRWGPPMLVLVGLLVSSSR